MGGADAAIPHSRLLPAAPWGGRAGARGPAAPPAGRSAPSPGSAPAAGRAGRDGPEPARRGTAGAALRRRYRGTWSGGLGPNAAGGRCRWPGAGGLCSAVPAQSWGSAALAEAVAAPRRRWIPDVKLQHLWLLCHCAAGPPKDHQKEGAL